MPAADIIIRNARIIDGSGEQPFEGDCALAADRIIALGNIGALRGSAEIDARGRILCPGFIDGNSHETGLAPLPHLLAQGVTTIIAGNGGLSLAPVTFTGAPPMPFAHLTPDPAAFRPGVGALLAAIAQARPQINLLQQIGHAALRLSVMPTLMHGATGTEMKAMVALLSSALAEGAAGLSCDLNHPFSHGAPTEELLYLAESLRDAGGFLSLGLRHQGASALSALDEVARIASRVRLPLVLSQVRMTRQSGLNHADITAKLADIQRLTPLTLALSPYSSALVPLGEALAASHPEAIIAFSGPEMAMAGRTLAQAAQLMGLDPVQAARSLKPGYVLVANSDEETLARLIGHDSTMICTDSLPVLSHPHPSGHGAFIRMLKAGAHGLSYHRIIHKMTGLPAAAYGLAGRGRLHEDAFADLVLFDPQALHDHATFKHPTRLARGVEAVWVNGVLSWRKGRATGLRGGRVLRREGGAGG